MVTLQLSIRTTTLLLHLLAILSQFPYFTISTKLTKLSLNLIHIYSPESPLYESNVTRHNDTSKLVRSMSTPYNSTRLLRPENIHFPITSSRDLALMVQFAIGTPSRPLFFLMDTGAGLIWTQCEPCKTCYRQIYPIYNSRASSTYRKLPCGHPLCHGPGAPYQCVNNECVYTITYGAGSVTKGLASFETFWFSVGTSIRSFPDIIFGCSNENYKMLFAQLGVISGIMGLDMSPDSFLTQMFPPTNRRFSYCLTPFSAGLPRSVLRFGDDIPVRSRNVQTIQLRPGVYTYQGELVDISVGRRRLRFPPGTFAPRGNRASGFIIDSGTLITRIDQTSYGVNAYATVLEAFRQFYDPLGLQRIRYKVGEGYDLCYRKPPWFSQFVGMTYHFRGADYVVDPRYTIFLDERGGGGLFCVALLAGNGVSVLGGFHQQNVRLIYDVTRGALQFTPEDCARDHI